MEYYSGKLGTWHGSKPNEEKEDEVKLSEKLDADHVNKISAVCLNTQAQHTSHRLYLLSLHRINSNEFILEF